MTTALSKSIHELKDKMLKDYAATFKRPPVDANIIISNNMEQSYRSVFGVKIAENPCPRNIESYHGLTLQPVDDNQTFSILINARYIIAKRIILNGSPSTKVDKLFLKGPDAK